MAEPEELEGSIERLRGMVYDLQGKEPSGTLAWKANNLLSVMERSIKASETCDLTDFKLGLPFRIEGWSQMVNDHVTRKYKGTDEWTRWYDAVRYAVAEAETKIVQNLQTKCGCKLEEKE